MTIIDQLQQLTHCIIAETSTTSRDDSHHMTAPSETTIDKIQYIGSHNVPHSSQIHFTTPFIPIAESTPLKSLRTQTVTVDTSTSPMFKHDKSFSQSLGLSENAPLSKEEEKLSTHLVRRKLNSDPGKQTLKCRTGGQPLVLQRVVAPRKHTTLVRTPTKRKRAKILNKVRSYVAGYSGESTDTQLATELKTLPTTRRQKIVLKAGVKQKLKISRHHTLAMKEALGMSWRQGKKHGKLLKKVGIHLDSEKPFRELSREIVSDFVQVEGRSFIKEDDSEYTSPYGPQGTYPCLWCLMPRRDMHNPRDHCEHRSLESLLADNKTFMQQTDGEKKQANKFYNSLHAPLVGIELGKVSPPYLHILLGVVLKHHKLLEDAAHKLDKKVACQPDDFLLPLGKLLKRYGSQWGRAYELQERLLYEEGCLGFSELSESQGQIDKYTQQIHKTEQLISFLMHKELQPRIGPIASSLDTVLTNHRITPQAYHSRSFVGNHCHKYLQSAVYTDLTQIIVTKTQQCTSNPMIIDEACTLQLLFDNLNNAFSTVHRAISHTKPIAPSSLPEIEIAIDTYMATCRRMFPRKIIPKQHLLEKHCIPHINQHLFGLGLLGEQGTENSHQMIGMLETRARGIKNDMCKLKFILSSHLLQVAPALRDSV
ncbi:amine oxidase [Plakobranchus ocellatus]|uniref:Amine oxidase n=1 Tax=Plakobranchus ocellatus TaxID=259542 RepID=A0AAV4DR85_9GAST|nr:amine oxidase [Plakobranchus ocellatus]